NTLNVAIAPVPRLNSMSAMGAWRPSFRVGHPGSVDAAASTASRSCWSCSMAAGFSNSQTSVAGGEASRLCPTPHVRCPVVSTYGHMRSPSSCRISDCMSVMRMFLVAFQHQGLDAMLAGGLYPFQRFAVVDVGRGNKDGSESHHGSQRRLFAIARDARAGGVARIALGVHAALDFDQQVGRNEIIESKLPIRDRLVLRDKRHADASQLRVQQKFTLGRCPWLDCFFGRSRFDGLQRLLAPGIPRRKLIFRPSNRFAHGFTLSFKCRRSAICALQTASAASACCQAQSKSALVLIAVGGAIQGTKSEVGIGTY